MIGQVYFRQNDPPLDTLSGDPQIEILYAGDLADDDRMWVALCSVDELRRLIRSPVAWVAALGSLPGWVDHGLDRKAPPPTLRPDFSMLVEPTGVETRDGWVLVQGISGTNELTLVAPRSSAVQALLAMGTVSEATQVRLDASEDPFGPFWDELGADPANPPTFKKPLPVVVLRPAARFFGHFEVLVEEEDPKARAARIAALLLACALDPSGFEGMLSGLDQRAVYVDGTPAQDGLALRILVPAAPSLVYANVVGDGGGDPGGGDDKLSVTCGVIQGPIDTLPFGGDPDDETVGTVTGTVVKRYGGDEPPPPPPPPESP